MQPIKYDLYPSRQLSIARSDAHQYVANVPLPVTTAMRQEIENYLTSFNRRTYRERVVSSISERFACFCLTEYGVAKIVYVEALTVNQTRFYVVVRPGI